VANEALVRSETAGATGPDRVGWVNCLKIISSLTWFGRRTRLKGAGGIIFSVTLAGVAGWR